MNRMNRVGWMVLLGVLGPAMLRAQQPSCVRKLAQTVMRTWPASLPKGSPAPKWSYDEGVYLQGLFDLWHESGDGRYFAYVRQRMNEKVDRQGLIQGYEPGKFRLDDINNGRILLELYRVTRKPRYLLAARRLSMQLARQPRTPQGGFWHKKIYPDQMWLDGLYMAEPFYAAYASLSGDTAAYRDIARQFLLVEQHLKDAHSDLYFHGWDASRTEAWASQLSGRSSCIWGRADGWLAMALVDVLDDLPRKTEARKEVLGMFRSFAAAICRYQDPRSGCWYQVMDQAGRAGNYLEASASCMFVYALAKGFSRGYLPKRCLASARKGYRGILQRFVGTDAQGNAYLSGTCKVAGLGGHPYRDGSYAYYLSEPVDTNDAKGLGAFLLASHQIDVAGGIQPAAGLSVTLDHYYNREFRSGPFGKQEPFHYLWTDEANSGYSTWGRLFRYHGARIRELPQAPSARNLPARSIYILADPDTRSETPHPHYIQPAQAGFLEQWVRQGGILVLMANDSSNCEFPHLNALAARFGMRFNEDSRNRVSGRQFMQGSILLDQPNPIWRNLDTAYIKELSSLRVQAPARALLKKDGYTVAALAQVGKGMVLAVGDPWFYNEYTDGRKLPTQFENFQTAGQLSLWLLQQSAARQRPGASEILTTDKQQ